MFIATASVKRLVAEAYSIPEVLIAGGPSWCGSDVYAISARTGAPATPEQLRLMLRALLAQRFHLKMRREMRETAYYALVQGKDGIRTKAIDPDDDRPSVARRDSLRVRNLAELATCISGVSGRIVVDQSGIEEIDATFGIRTLTDEQLGGGDALSKATAIRDAYFADLVHGAENVGLKLEARKSALEFLVIDAAARPEEN
jgi:uncharacterized protein (TIGR03435 family)